MTHTQDTATESQVSSTLRKRIASLILGAINPLHDPSMLVAIILTTILEIGSQDTPLLIAVHFMLMWITVKSFTWLAINLVFACSYLFRKAWWAIRNPALAWRLLDALGNEDILIGPIREYLGEQANTPGIAPHYLEALAQKTRAAALPGGAVVLEQADAAGLLPSAADQERILAAFITYSRFVHDWAGYVEERYQTLSDSQLGWKSLHGRYSGWDDIYQESWGAFLLDPLVAQASRLAGDFTSERYKVARERGSAASSVACFLKDVYTLHHVLDTVELPEEVRVRLFGQEPTPASNQSQSKVGVFARQPYQVVDAE